MKTKFNPLFAEGVVHDTPVEPVEPVDSTAPTETTRLDWMLSFATGDDSDLANRRTMLLVNEIYAGLDGRAAVDAAMLKEVA